MNNRKTRNCWWDWFASDCLIDQLNEEMDKSRMNEAISNALGILVAATFGLFKGLFNIILLIDRSYERLEHKIQMKTVS